MYTQQFGESLIEAFKMHRPRRTLRQKVEVDPRATDVELFGGLPFNDLWEDASLLEVYSYLRCGGKDKIPDTWVSTMNKFDEDLALLGLHV